MEKLADILLTLPLLSFLYRRNKMPLKRIGALWNKQDKKEQPYFSGTLDLGVLGEAQIMVFQNKHKEEENHPDAIVHLVVNDETGQ